MRQDRREDRPFRRHTGPTNPNEFIFGRQSILEALKAGTRDLHKIWILEGTGGDILQEIEQLARGKGIPVERARREHLDKRVPQGHHQGIVAQASAVEFLELDEFLKRPLAAGTVVVALDEVQDPHNIGAVLRSAGFFGVSAVLVPRWRSAPVGETAARVSSGAIEHVPLIRVKNLAESVEELKDAGFEVIGADMEGSPLEGHVAHTKTAIVLGGEGKGLRRLVKERCDKLIKIPGAGKVASLNVSAAAAVFLYAFCRGKAGPTTM